MTAALSAPTTAGLSRSQKQTLRRLAWAALIALLLHILFFVVAPYLKLVGAPLRPTEVVQISPEELAKLKQQIAKNKVLPALLEQELREKYKTKEAPKDPKFMGKFNQSVPEETIAGAQPDAPQIAQGGGSGKNQRAQAPTRSQPKVQPQMLHLSDLGPGYKLPKPIKDRSEDSAMPGAKGPPQHFRPLGRDDKDMKHGDDNLLNAVESEYYSFFSRFEEPIVRNWYFNLRAQNDRLHYEMARKGLQAGAELPVTIRFTIDRSGRFTSIDVVESSGIPMLDNATRAAVAKLGSLPNPPPGIFEGQSTFSYHLRFMVQLTDTPVGSPGLQWY
jgi:TonB family protein